MQLESPTFILLNSKNYETINIAGSLILVKVWSLKYQDVKFKADDIVYYADYMGDYLAFQVTGNQPFSDTDMQLVSMAMMWYAKRLDYPELEISTFDPRPKHAMRLVN